MRRILSAAIMVCCARFHASANPELEIVLKGGPNIATTTDDSAIDLHSRYGFSGGLAGYLLRPLVDGYSLGGQLELLYAQRGTRLTSMGEDVAKIRMHYLDVVFAMRPEAHLGPTNVYLVLGGGLNILTTATSEGASGVKDITSDLHRLEVSLRAGGGVALRVPPWSLGPLHLRTAFIEANYNYGLLDTDAVNGGFKNRELSFMLGLSFAMTSTAPVVTPVPAPAQGKSSPAAMLPRR